MNSEKPDHPDLARGTVEVVAARRQASLGACWLIWVVPFIARPRAGVLPFSRVRCCTGNAKPIDKDTLKVMVRPTLVANIAAARRIGDAHLRTT